MKLKSPPRLHALAVGVVLTASTVLTAVDAAKGPRQEFKLDIPRVTQAQLLSNDTLRSGLHAYILEGVTGNWTSTSWTLDYLAKRIPFEWVDYYENNMAEAGSKPFLFKYQDALPRFENKGPKPRYMQLRLSLRGWNRLKKDFTPKPVPSIFWSDDEWVGDCMKKPNGKVDKKGIDNFYTTQQWKFLLIGEKGTSMFLHKDGTCASTWQAQLVGKKKWTICPNTESRYLRNSLDTFDPKTASDPNFAKALCGQVTVGSGELLYYPGYWWHHTLQLETPSIAYTGALVGTEINRDDIGRDSRPHRAFQKDLEEKCSKCWTQGKPDRHCDDISLQWPGAAPPIMREVCDEYLPKCFDIWDGHSKMLNEKVSKTDEL